MYLNYDYGTAFRNHFEHWLLMFSHIKIRFSQCPSIHLYSKVNLLLVVISYVDKQNDTRLKTWQILTSLKDLISSNFPLHCVSIKDMRNGVTRSLVWDAGNMEPTCWIDNMLSSTRWSENFKDLIDKCIPRFEIRSTSIHNLIWQCILVNQNLQEWNKCVFLFSTPLYSQFWIIDTPVNCWIGRW